MSKSMILFALFTLISIFKSDLYSQSLIKLSGSSFFEYYYNVSNSQINKKDMQGFQFRRIYFTTDFDVTKKLSARFRVESDGINFKDEKKFSAYMKDVYFQYKTNNTQILGGLIPTPSIEIEEFYWGYRSIEKVQSDLRGFVATRDLGVSVKYDNPTSSLKWVAMVGNNSSHGEETDKYKRLYLHTNYNFSDYLITSLDFSFANGSAIKNYYLTRIGLFFPKFINKKFRGGITIINSLKEENSGEIVKSLATSIFSNYTLNEKLRTFLRFDLFEVNTKKMNDMEYTLIGGLDFIIEKNLSLIPNVIYNVYENPNKESDLTLRLTASYNF